MERRYRVETRTYNTMLDIRLIPVREGDIDQGMEEKEALQTVLRKSHDHMRWLDEMEKTDETLVRE